MRACHVSVSSDLSPHFPLTDLIARRTHGCLSMGTASDIDVALWEPSNSQERFADPSRKSLRVSPARDSMH